MGQSKQFPIDVELGATFNLAVIMERDGAVVTTITSAAMSIRNVNYDGAILFALVDPGDITITAGQGLVEVSITAAATAAIRASLAFDERCVPPRAVGVYDLEVTESGTGEVTRLLQGPVTFLDESTR